MSSLFFPSDFCFVYIPKIVFCVRHLLLAWVLILASVFVLPNMFSIWFRSMLDRFLHWSMVYRYRYIQYVHFVTFLLYLFLCVCTFFEIQDPYQCFLAFGALFFGFSCILRGSWYLLKSCWTMNIFFYCTTFKILILLWSCCLRN